MMSIPQQIPYAESHRHARALPPASTSVVIDMNGVDASHPPQVPDTQPRTDTEGKSSPHRGERLLAISNLAIVALSRISALGVAIVKMPQGARGAVEVCGAAVTAASAVGNLVAAGIAFRCNPQMSPADILKTNWLENLLQSRAFGYVSPEAVAALRSYEVTASGIGLIAAVGAALKFDENLAPLDTALSSDDEPIDDKHLNAVSVTCLELASALGPSALNALTANGLSTVEYVRSKLGKRTVSIAEGGPNKYHEAPAGLAKDATVDPRAANASGDACYP